MLSDNERNEFILSCEDQGLEIQSSLSPNLNSTTSMEQFELVPSELPVATLTTSSKIFD